MRAKPEIVLKNGKPSAVILKIEDYEELLERLEDAEDIKWLKEVRQKALHFRTLDSPLLPCQGRNNLSSSSPIGL